MELVHYSKQEIPKLEPRVWLPELSDQHGNFKPLGAFWFSDDSDGDGWWDWITGEEMDIEDGWDYRWRYPVIISPDAKMLKVKPERVLSFTGEYGEDICERLPTRGYYHDGGLIKSVWPKWQRVAEQYDGVLFTPYQRGLMFKKMYEEAQEVGWPPSGGLPKQYMDLTWYSGIDCASGFVFDTKHITLGEGVKFR